MSVTSGSESDQEDAGWSTESETEEVQYIETRSEFRLRQALACKEKLRLAGIWSAEHKLDGPGHRSGGHNPQEGKSRGPYKVGGLSLRRIQEKKKKLRDTAADGRISDTELAKQLANIDQQAQRESSLKQQKLGSFFMKRPCASAPSPSPPSSPPPSKRQRVMTSPGAPPTDDILGQSDTGVLNIAEEEIENIIISSSEDEEEPSGEVIQQEEAVDEALEWIEVVSEDLPVIVADFQSLAEENLKTARKKGQYKSELLFVCLTDFYRWTPRQGHISVSCRVSHNHGRGESFTRLLRSNARYFEKHQALKPRQQGKQVTGGSLLDDEDIILGIQRWLRTVETGKVTPFLLKKQVNEVILPSFASRVQKKSICVKTAARWLYQLGFRHKRYTKSVYYDGHERKDVRNAHTVYLEVMEELQKWTREYGGDEMKSLPLELKEGEKERDYWLQPGQSVLRKKEKGRLMMVSDFICQSTGPLMLSEELWEVQLAKPEVERLSTGPLMLSEELWEVQLAKPEVERLPQHARVIRTNTHHLISLANLAYRVVLLNCAAITTSTIMATNALLNIWSAPDSDKTVTSIREEQCVFQEHNGEWSESALSKLYRRVRAEDGISLPKGLWVPKGATIGVSMNGVYFDEAFYANVNEFDAFRDPERKHYHLVRSLRKMKTSLRHQNIGCLSPMGYMPVLVGSLPPTT
ncbi:hypothetical protein M422DRAFT_242125 [Sphaerobolus stellatus SS14]|nr:hypothetical protein M422DRAFT_242125 [Sphaerobolus stellatus SS14]